MALFSSTLATIKKNVVHLISEPEAFVAAFSSYFFAKTVCFSIKFQGGQMFFLHWYAFILNTSIMPKYLFKFLLSPLYLWKEAKEALMFSTKRPIFNIYYGFQLLLEKLDIQPNYNKMIDDGKQVGADLTEICKKSVENLKFVLNHDIMTKIIVDDSDYQRIGYFIYHHNTTNCLDSLNKETTLLLFQELEKKYEKQMFEKVVSGFLRRAMRRQIDLFYFICNAFGDKYNVYECCSGNLIIDCFDMHDLNLFKYLLSKSKQMNLDAIVDFGFFNLTLYGYALHYEYNVERTMLFSHGATPCFSFHNDSDFDLEYKMQEDTFHGLLYCLHYRNVFVFL